MHAGRYRAGDEQDVGMPRGSDDAETESLQIVIRAREQCQLVLAAVAGAGVDVADRKARCALWPCEVELPTEPAEIAKECQHQRSAHA